jgi:hypothetical protein
MNQKQNIIEYLENAYSGAKAMDDVELMLRLSRAIIAFSYDNLEENKPDWDKMMDAYMFD